jgi:hypothetical protein
MYQMTDVHTSSRLFTFLCFAECCHYGSAAVLGTAMNSTNWMSIYQGMCDEGISEYKNKAAYSPTIASALHVHGSPIYVWPDGQSSRAASYSTRSSAAVFTPNPPTSLVDLHLRAHQSPSSLSVRVSEETARRCRQFRRCGKVVTWMALTGQSPQCRVVMSAAANPEWNPKKRKWPKSGQNDGFECGDKMTGPKLVI